ncbi:MAG: DUF1573 domain-containing protein [Verrucomicrobiota bacterium]
MRFSPLLCGFSMIALPAMTSHGQQLQWEQAEQKFTPSATDSAVVAHFQCKNVGMSEVKFTSVTSPCACTTPVLRKKQLAPGESGEVTATFTFGSRTGLQEKTLLVESNDRDQPRKILKLVTTIPKVVEVNPTFLFWPASQPLVSREISLKVLNGFPIHAFTVTSSDPRVSAKVEPLKPGGEFRVVVSVPESPQPVTALLQITADYPPENPKVFNATVRVEGRK